MEQNEYSRRGYLKEEFRLFHIKDNVSDEIEYHYHEFDKIVLFISGRVSYMIEGITYPLQPWDILLIKSHTVHRAVIDPSADYERIIIYIDPEISSKIDTDQTELMRCFRDAEANRFHLLRPGPHGQEEIKKLILNLEAELKSDKYGADVSAKLHMFKLLVTLNRAAISVEQSGEKPSVTFDPKIAAVISYINENLSEELTVEKLAAKSYISKYHFMRRFKELTGYTVHSYIQQKRLIVAAELIRGGAPATAAATSSGFKDYSTFQRAFKKMYGVSPVKMK